MNTNNWVDLKAAKNLPDYVIFECAHLKILPLEQYYPEEGLRFLNKSPLALVLRIITNEICIVLIEKKKEISLPLEHLFRFTINERRDIELEMKREFKKFYYEYPLGELGFRIQIAMDPLGGFLDKITTIVFSPWYYVEDEIYLRLTCEMRRLRFNKPKESSEKQTIKQLIRFQEPSNQLQHKESLENEFVSVSRQLNHDRSFNQDQEQPNVTNEVEPVRSHFASFIERNKTNTENTMDLPTDDSPKASGVSNKCLLDMNCRELMSFLNNKPEVEDSISISRPSNKELFTNNQYESEITYSGTMCAAEVEIFIFFWSLHLG
ncbi:12161_t:CDS:2 [Funneliformis mosseae]|uniref:12161_t:CDS:1 n=1 Tax=Funneliformis mosseae TaxID=27381 RepID=A0A9N9D2K8_FUNMO|nr:12161_t:CDS:2 [Funneliformis mosseae]